MNILIGILYSNEPQYHLCTKSIENQRYDHNFDYFVISGLSKQEAHDKLYERFSLNNDSYDIFIKLDADMIIKRSDFFNYIHNLFTKNVNLDWVRILVFDEFLQSNISGLNIYSKNVKWSKNLDNYFTDRTLVLSSVKKHIGIDPKVKWVTHCENPSTYQAFNFGFHRAIKIFQFEKINKVSFKIHWAAFQTVLNNYSKNINNHNNNNLIILATLVYVSDYKLGSESINNFSKSKIEAYDFLTGKNSFELWEFFSNSIYNYFLRIPLIGYYIFYLYRFIIIQK